MLWMLSKAPSQCLSLYPTPWIIHKIFCIKFICRGHKSKLIKNFITFTNFVVKSISTLFDI
ncbi:hypothetical protein ALO57_200173 [Pseudomonas coronafaciens pv. oryzae]|nr:hypothetical protein ALO57_200173 [Pseudomonas coronafaciens pv. oryzae]